MNLGDVQVDLEGSTVIAHVSGELDLSNVNGIEQAIIVATPNQVEVVLLDLSEVGYLDSSGIHLIYRLREKLQSRGQVLRLILEENSPAADALQLAGVMDHLDIWHSVQAALD